MSSWSYQFYTFHANFNHFLFSHIFHIFILIYSFRFWYVTQPSKNRSFSSHKLNSTFFHTFSAAHCDSVLSFLPATQVSEIVLNESSKSSENALIEWLEKDTTKYFLKSKVYVVSLVMSVVSKTAFGIFLAHLVCLKSENQKCLEASKCISQG
jgi:hypothetical protein